MRDKKDKKDKRDNRNKRYMRARVMIKILAVSSNHSYLVFLSVNSVTSVANLLLGG
jgi:hypothetical protein